MAQCTLQFIYNKTFRDDDGDGDALVTTAAATSDGAFDVDGDDKCKSKHACLNCEYYSTHSHCRTIESRKLMYSPCTA